MVRKMVFVVSALKGGGAEKFVLNLYKAMEKYQGYECHIVSIDKAVEHDIDGYRVHFVSDFCNVSKKGLRRLSYKKNIARSVEQYIIRNISKDAFVLSNMLLADKIMSKSTLRVHHIIHSSYYSAFLKGRNWLKAIKIKSQINSIYKNHPLVFVSKASQFEYEDNFATKTKNKVIYNPIEVSDIEAMSQLNTDIDITQDYFVHVGRFNRAKRHDRLIDAYSQLSSHSTKLLLLGGGSGMSAVKLQVNNMGLKDFVVFGGFSDNPYPYIKNAKALVLTSDFEGLPTVLIEAIALGTPIITTNCSGGVLEIVDVNSKAVVKDNDPSAIAHAMNLVGERPDCFKSSLSHKFLASEVALKYHNLNISTYC
ncbi:glycosyltransferase [Vibrio kanaloae]|uniref:glycosyltransferase n=1 Tax=Vibrio kanaloae TaxID=170673 RepID=UPI000988B5C0|nr:glycosyltransferase [Vibrio kanaloae]QPK05387.1 glycosyltransferase [Vibrio kanaloae]TKE99934.1 glycosyltransferase [Vibrio kanaloae]TKF61590.1 glycosyltransferase [Vibrio kanaloae]